MGIFFAQHFSSSYEEEKNEKRTFRDQMLHCNPGALLITHATILFHYFSD